MSGVFDSSLAWSQMVAAVDHAWHNDLFPGAVLGVLDTAGQTRVHALGSLRQHASDNHPVLLEQVVSPTTIYDAASVTKAIPTGMIALELTREGKWSLEDRLVDWLAEYHGDLAETLTIGQLLRFQVPFAGSLSQQKDQSISEILNSIFCAHINESELNSEKYWYINKTSILLALALEKVECQKLHRAAALRCFQPGQMVDSSLYYSKDLLRTAPAEIDSWRGGEVCGQTHDESAWKLHGGGSASTTDSVETIDPGSAGLFATVPDILAYLNQPQVWELLEWSSSQHSQVLGWEQHQPWLGLPGQRNTVFGKTGFTGCCVFGDVATRRVGVLLSNATYPRRPTSKDAMQQLRRALVEAWLT